VELDRGCAGFAYKAARTLDCRSEPAVLANRNPVLPERTRCTLKGSESFSEWGDEVATAVSLVETVEMLKHRWAAHPVDGNARVALKVHHGPDGVIAEDRVDPTGVESKRREATLQLTNVISSEHPVPAIEQPIAEPVTGFDECVPCTTVETSGVIDSVCALKSPQSLFRRRSEQPGRIARGAVELGEPKLEVEDDATFVARTDVERIERRIGLGHGARPYQ
jgi:hypothetical protein